jgi:hypothetical protein
VDQRAAEWAAIWQSELNAFGYVDGHLQGVGEHDDTVVASWMCERAVRMFEVHRPRTDDVVTGEDMGIQRVNLGAY